MSYKPKAIGPATFNADEAAAAAEIALKPFVVTWRGQEWELAHIETFDSWEVDALDPEDLVNEMMNLAMGADRWAEFKSAPIPYGTLKGIYEAYSKYCGIDPGKSGRSARS